MTAASTRGLVSRAARAVARAATSVPGRSAMHRGWVPHAAEFPGA